MVKVILDAKIEFPLIDDDIAEIINRELKKDLEKESNRLSRKVERIIERYSRLNIYNESA